MHFSIVYAIALFFLAMILEAVYARYTFALTKHQSLLAGVMSGLVYVIGAIGVVSYVSNKLYLIPISIGAFIGTIIVVEYEKRNNIK
jgi:4-hydroxybenzoate polyprenyltransferase